MALPWAAQPAAQASASQIRLPRSGERIQIKWRVDDETTGATAIRWWGATVTEVVASADAAAAGETVAPLTARILYDAWGGFDAEPATVAFIDAHSLVTPTDEEDAMRWRFEGSEEDSEEDEGGDDDNPLTLQDLDRKSTAEIAALAADAGVHSIDTAAAAAAVAAAGSVEGAAAATEKFRAFAEAVKASLAARAAEGDGVVLGEADVRRAVEEAKRRAQG